MQGVHIINIITVLYFFIIYLYFSLATYILMTQYKSLILILLAYKNATSSHFISSFFIEKYF
jgi:hypothetical protein